MSWKQNAATTLDAWLLNSPQDFDAIVTYLAMQPEDVREVMHWHRMNLSQSTALVQFWIGADSYYEVTGDPRKIKDWVIARLKDGDTRLHTMLAVAQVAVPVTNPRSKLGKKVRLIVKHVGRLVDDIEDLIDQVE